MATLTIAEWGEAVCAVTCGERYADDVVAERPHEVVANAPERLSTLYTAAEASVRWSGRAGASSVRGGRR